MTSILSIGLRSLMAFQSAIETSAQNLQNARTPFYSRRQINLVASMFNGGVEIRDVNRIFDEASNTNFLRATSALSSIDSYLSNISDLEKLLDSDSTSVNKYINDSLTAIQELTKDIGSPQMRGSYLAKLSNITNQLNAVGAEISRRKSDVNKNIESTVDTINNITQQIAALNSKIAQSTPDMKADYQDQQNALVHQLSQYINFNTKTDANGMVGITLENGLGIITGERASLFATKIDSNDPTKINIMMGTSSGSLSVIDGFISGGELGGLLNFRSQALDATERNLGKLSLALASAFNNQNHLGVDGYGHIGGNIFTDINDAELKSSRVTVASTNTGNAQLSVNIDSIAALTASNYKITFTDATHYTMTRLNDNAVVSSGAITSIPASISVDGITTSFDSGTISAGDTFYIKPTASALAKSKVVITDPLKLALGYPVEASANSANQGSGSINVDKIVDTNNASFMNQGQLNPPIQIVFLSENSYQIVDANTNAVLEGPIAYDPSLSQNVFPTPLGYDPGYRISLSGNNKAGDKFDINFNTHYATDNRNALEIAKLYGNKILDNQTMTLNEAYRFAANDISLKTNMAKGNLDSAGVLYKQAENRFSQLSGVSDIEEMNNIAEYQQAYQACAEVVQVARSVFDVIVKLVG